MKATAINKNVIAVASVFVIGMASFNVCTDIPDTHNYITSTLSCSIVASAEGASDIVNIAKSYSGKTQKEMGYTTAWCAWFVSDMAAKAGQSSAVPRNGGVDALYSAVINAGGEVVTKPRAGDLVFFKCNKCGRLVHVAIMIDSKKVIHGNYYYNPSTPNKSYSHVQIMSDTTFIDCNGHNLTNSVIYVRPNYKGNTIIDNNTNHSMDSSLKDGAKVKIVPKVAESCAVTAILNKNFGNVCLRNNNEATTWTAKKYGDYWYFVNDKGYVLDIYGNTAKAKSNMQVYKFNKKPSDTQLFKVNVKSDYAYLTLKGTNVALDVYGDSGFGRNTNVWSWQLTYDKTQAFRFEYV